MYQYTVEALLMDTLVSRQLYLPPLSQNLDSVWTPLQTQQPAPVNLLSAFSHPEGVLLWGLPL